MQAAAPPTTSSRSLIDIDRSPSHARSPSRSRHHVPAVSPVGSPTSSSPSLASSPPLRSAMKHLRLEPSLSDATLTTLATPDDDGPDEPRGRAGMPDSGLRPVSPTTAPAMYTRRVGFDTFDSGVELEATGSNTGGGTGVNFSFTTSAKSAGFSRTKQTRTFLVGTDLNEYSQHALSFVLTQLAEDHDEIVVLRVIDPAAQTKPAELASARDEAEHVLERIMRENGDEIKISIIVEFAVGPIEETIHRMIEVYTPDSLIVGTRGLPDSVWKSAFMGSISRYCVARSPVPVVVVRPEDKVREALSRRLHDPKRRSYLSLVGLSSSTSNSLLGPADSTDSGGGGGPLERTKTAPQSIGGGSRDRSTSRDGRKEDKAADKKGREFKKFGTFS